MNEKLEALIRKLYGLIQPGAEMYGSASKPLNAQQAGMLGNLMADMTPVVGDIKSAYEGVQAAREGDWMGAGLGALGALPAIPNFAGIGRTDELGRQIKSMTGGYPTQAELAGRLHYLGLVTPRGARDIYNLGKGERGGVDPELLKLIEDEAIKRGKAMY